MKILKWVGNNFLFLATVFLLAFIPLYPKIPILDITHTWVYVRAEDFIVAFVLLIWIILLLLRKVTLKTPLTIPIMLFWIIGAITTLHGVMLIFPTLADVFPNVALLSFFRRIEYISLFFIAFSSIKSKKAILYTSISLIVILLAIVGYGFGQKYLGFPAFLTMNEEFAKGIPIQLSSLSRVPSTFAGHYDLAAYLVLIIPILVSLVFGFRNIFLKIILLITSMLGFVLLFMTVSRVSFFVLLLSLLLLLILQRKRIIIFSLLALTIILLIASPSLLQRFKGTVTEVNVLVDAKTGNAVGQVKQVPAEYFKNKIVKKIPISNEDAQKATSSSAILPFEFIPKTASLVVEANISNGENLPQGTSYVNLPLSPVIKKVDEYYFQKATNENGVKSEEIRVYYGDYLIKKAKAYDMSFTTRFQGEWPKTFEAFKRNIFLGSGYGSVSLAVDNNYLRILGESGLLGFTSFALIFVVSLIYIAKILPKVDSPVAKSFVIGFIAGSFGLILNGFLIDVFEASKIAFSYWLLMGITLGTLSLYESDRADLSKELKKAITSPFAIIAYISILVGVIFYPIIANYFVGDDFTWLRWASDGYHGIVNYFANADGFFYRPGTKLYFSLMYSMFWLNQAVYHLTSIILHLAVSIMAFLVFRKILKNYLLSVISAILFVILSCHHEMIFWIASTGHLFNALFSLSAVLAFIYYREKNKVVYFITSLILIALSLLFHELGVVVPLLIIAYDFIYNENMNTKILYKKISYLALFVPVLIYLVFRYFAQSHWFNGDYSYNLVKLPLNILGNIFGYLVVDLFGPQALSIYDAIRAFLKGYIPAAIVLSLIVIVIVVVLAKKVLKRMGDTDRKNIIFALSFFVIALIPFLGLGNITSRYSYLSSVGFVIILGYVFKKISISLISISNRQIGSACVVIISAIYLMSQLFGLQKLHTDWKKAGDKSQKFLVSVERYSKDSWMRKKMQFYFVDMPTKEGEAWIWPVGLKDAIWFSFKNPNIGVSTVSDINSAFNLANGDSNAHVFKFDGDGGVDEFVRSANGEINLLNPPR